jgi:hypothetical protein
MKEKWRGKNVGESDNGCHPAWHKNGVSVRKVLPYNYPQMNDFFIDIFMKIEGCEGGLSCLWVNAVCAVVTVCVSA